MSTIYLHIQSTFTAAVNFPRLCPGGVAICGSVNARSPLPTIFRIVHFIVDFFVLDFFSLLRTETFQITVVIFRRLRQNGESRLLDYIYFHFLFLCELLMVDCF